MEKPIDLIVLHSLIKLLIGHKKFCKKSCITNYYEMLIISISCESFNFYPCDTNYYMDFKLLKTILILEINNLN